jgi:hypothetical protein
MLGNLKNVRLSPVRLIVIPAAAVRVCSNIAKPRVGG